MPTVDPNSQRPLSRWAWMWLAYTAFLFIQPLLEPSRNLWLATIACFIVFLSIFRTLFHATSNSGPRRFWAVGATFALGLAVFPWNGGGSTFFIYAAAILPFLIDSSRRVVTLILIESLAIFAEGAYFTLA